MGPQEYFKGMRDYFNIENPADFYDKYYLNQKVIKLDILKFVDWLEKNHGPIYDDNVSLHDEVVNRFGAEACTFLIQLL